MNKFNFDTFLLQISNHPELRHNNSTKTYAKGEHVFVQGEICADLFCMHSGLVKLYFNTLEGKEWIKSFIPDQGVFGSRNAQSMGKPSPFSALCLEETRIFSIPYGTFEEVIFKDLELSRAVFHFTQWLGLKKELREYQLLCLSAEEAYQAFISTNPSLVERLTQIDIARYLGITPIALSRIKKRLM